MFTLLVCLLVAYPLIGILLLPVNMGKKGFELFGRLKWRAKLRQGRRIIIGNALRWPTLTWKTWVTLPAVERRELAAKEAEE